MLQVQHNGKAEFHCPEKRRRLPPEEWVQDCAPGRSKITFASMEIYVKDLQGVTHTLYVTPDFAVEDVKNEIALRFDIPPGQQRLISAGKQLEDGLTLRDYNIVQHNTLRLLLRLRAC